VFRRKQLKRNPFVYRAVKRIGSLLAKVTVSRSVVSGNVLMLRLRIVGDTPPKKGVSMPFETSVDRGKRQVDYLLLSGASVGTATQVGGAFAPEPLHAQSSLKLDSALQELMGGNEYFTTNQLTSIEDDLAILKEWAADKQESFAAVLACSDSPVPAELIIDQTIRNIFVCRFRGNTATSEIIAGLEYGVAVLGVKTVLVLGHSSYGEVKTALRADAVPRNISVLSPHLRRAVEESERSQEKAIADNTAMEAELLRASSPLIRDAIKQGKLKVEAGVYDLATGKVSLNAAADRVNETGFHMGISAAALLACCLVLNGGPTLRTTASARPGHAPEKSTSWWDGMRSLV
jgi:carbonic anhydrase